MPDTTEPVRLKSYELRTAQLCVGDRVTMDSLWWVRRVAVSREGGSFDAVELVRNKDGQARTFWVPQNERWQVER